MTKARAWLQVESFIFAAATKPRNLLPQLIRMKNQLLLLALVLFSTALFAQKGGTIRGNVYDKNTGEPIIYGTVFLRGTTIGTNTNEDGFYSIGGVPEGEYTVVATYVGYDSATVDVKMDTSQEQENVPLPTRFCFLLTAYFLVQTTLSNSASSCC